MLSLPFLESTGSISPRRVSLSGVDPKIIEKWRFLKASKSVENASKMRRIHENDVEKRQNASKMRRIHENDAENRRNASKMRRIYENDAEKR